MLWVRLQLLARKGLGAAERVLRVLVGDRWSELRAVDRQGEGELGQGFGWLGVLVAEWWV